MNIGVIGSGVYAKALAKKFVILKFIRNFIQMAF